MEIWKTVEDAPGYEVSNLARVRNKRTGKILSPRLDRYGYLKIHLIRNDGGNFYSTIHRLVAKAWVDGYASGLQVNHKDGCKSNNAPINLEWVEAKRNINHAYETGLNKNCVPIEVENVSTGECRPYQSLKIFAKHIGLQLSVLMPLVKHSPENPVMGHYVVRVRDEDQMQGIANAVHFGRTVFCLDELTGVISEYPSILSASYHTALRSLSNININLDNGVYRTLGYQFSFDRERLECPVVIDGEELRKARESYVRTPYVKRDHTYFHFDYRSGVESVFSTLDDLVDYLNRIDPQIHYTNHSVTMAIGEGAKANRSGLIRGHGVKSSRKERAWYPYAEEVIITNRLRRFAVPVWKVRYADQEKLAVGKIELCEILGYRAEKNLNQIRVDEIIRCGDIPNASVVRLNNPIVVNKTKI